MRRKKLSQSAASAALTAPLSGHELRAQGGLAVCTQLLRPRGPAEPGRRDGEEPAEPAERELGWRRGERSLRTVLCQE